MYNESVSEPRYLYVASYGYFCTSGVSVETTECEKDNRDQTPRSRIRKKKENFRFEALEYSVKVFLI